MTIEVGGSGGCMYFGATKEDLAAAGLRIWKIEKFGWLIFILFLNQLFFDDSHNMNVMQPLYLRKT